MEPISSEEGGVIIEANPSLPIKEEVLDLLGQLTDIGVGVKVSDDVLDLAISSTLSYEAGLASKKKGAPAFVKIVKLDVPRIADLDLPIPSHMIKQKMFHVTLFFGQKQGESPPLELKTLIEAGMRTFPIRIIGYKSDDKAMALIVDIGTVPCFNAIPHITYALAPGVQPVYSNEMLGYPGEIVPLDITVMGMLSVIAGGKEKTVLK